MTSQYSQDVRKQSVKHFRKFLLGRSLILLGISFQSFTPKREILSKSPVVVKPGSQFVFCKMGHLPSFPLRVNDEVF